MLPAGLARGLTYFTFTQAQSLPANIAREPEVRARERLTSLCQDVFRAANLRVKQTRWALLCAPLVWHLAGPSCHDTWSFLVPGEAECWDHGSCDQQSSKPGRDPRFCYLQAESSCSSFYPLSILFCRMSYKWITSINGNIRIKHYHKG